MNNKLLLVQGITLLYRESQLPKQLENSAALVRDVITSIKLPEVSLGIDHERDILAGLKSIALTMCETPIEHKYEASELMQRLKVTCSDDEGLYDALCDGMLPEMDDATIKRTCLHMKRLLANHFREDKIAEIVRKANSEINYNRNKITDMTKWIAEKVAQLEPYRIQSEVKDPAILSDVSSDKPGQMAEVFRDIKKKESGESKLISGWQGMNRMLGGGYDRGPLVTMAALQHQYKTGFSLQTFASLAMFNVPVMRDPTKKPLMVHFSFEDDHDITFHLLYKMLKECELGSDIEISLDGLAEQEIEDYVTGQLERTGYTVRFLRVNPSLWCYRDVQNKIIELEAEGFEVHVCMMDYLLKLPLTGCIGTAAGEALRNLFEHVRNFMAARKILTFTPHQISTDAKMLLRNGQLDFVKQLPGMGYYAGSKQLDQVIDIELFQHIEKVNHESFLTIQRGKHRGKIGQTPDADLFCVLKFGKYCIPFDINKPDTSRRKAGGGCIGATDETPFWSTEDSI